MQGVSGSSRHRLRSRCTTEVKHYNIDFLTRLNVLGQAWSFCLAYFSFRFYNVANSKFAARLERDFWSCCGSSSLMWQGWYRSVAPDGFETPLFEKSRHVSCHRTWAQVHCVTHTVKSCRFSISFLWVKATLQIGKKIMLGHWMITLHTRPPRILLQEILRLNACFVGKH